ncbi:MAG: hypothetical protein S4CHLAM27_11010 [Chlamydiia bacterium]|nr:hypothetical protein [Chlamydiia bacterium]
MDAARPTFFNAMYSKMSASVTSLSAAASNLKEKASNVFTRARDVSAPTLPENSAVKDFFASDFSLDKASYAEQEILIKLAHIIQQLHSYEKVDVAELSSPTAKSLFLSKIEELKNKEKECKAELEDIYKYRKLGDNVDINLVESGATTKVTSKCTLLLIKPNIMNLIGNIFSPSTRHSDENAEILRDLIDNASSVTDHPIYLSSLKSLVRLNTKSSFDTNDLRLRRSIERNVDLAF